MTSKIVILSILVLQVNASFYSELRGAMSSVENAFGKLLNDVVTDVKSTVHCTILAMEQVLAMRGIVTEPATYNNDCDDYMDSVDASSYKSGYEFKTSSELGNLYIPSHKHIAQQISSSISRVNKSLVNILDNVGHERLEQIKGLLEHETNRLTKVGHLLRQELDKITHKIKQDFQSIENTHEESSIESIWNDMKILHDVERNQNISEAKEIGQVLNDALNVLHINNTSKVTSDEEKMEAIMEELQHETNNTNLTYTNINKELSQWKDEKSQQQHLSSHKLIPEVTSKTINEVGTNFNKVQNTTDIAHHKENEHPSEPANAITNYKEIDNKYEEVINDKNQTEEESLFIDKNIQEHKKTIDEANDILKNSAQAQMKLDNIFGNDKNQTEEESPRKRTHKIKKDFQSIENTHEESSIESIWNDMKILHDVERNQNISEAKEIGQVLNDALNVLHINNTSKVTSDEEKMEAIMEELQHETNNTNLTYTNINKELSQWKDEKSQQQHLSSHKLIPEVTSKTINEVATNFNKVQNTTDIAHHNENEHPSEPANAITNYKEIDNKYEEVINDKNQTEEESLFIDKNIQEHKKTIDEANDIIKNSAQAQMMLDNIFGKTSSSADSIFDNPEFNI